jgi:hypothetical protein
MRLLRRWRDGEYNGGAEAIAAAPAESLEELRAQIAALTCANRSSRALTAERELLRLRYRAGIRLLETAPQDPSFAEPSGTEQPNGSGQLPEYSRGQLTPGLLRAALLRDGCALVRGLIESGDAIGFAEGIERAYRARESTQAGHPDTEGYYEEFDPDPRLDAMGRGWVKLGGGLLAADSPRLSFDMTELFDSAGLPQLLSAYLGEPPVMSAHKTTLRKAEPSVSGAWHQDGFFMGPVRSINVWLSLSRCGDEAPGLDILPRRLNQYVATGTEGADLTWTISEREVQQAAAGTAVARPIFEPGDALIFDEMFLHKTGSDPAMSAPRFAIESWFFGGSAFPGEYAPLAI